MLVVARVWTTMHTTSWHADSIGDMLPPSSERLRRWICVILIYRRVRIAAGAMIRSAVLGNVRFAGAWGAPGIAG